MANKKFELSLTRWDVLNTNLRLHEDELPGLQPGQQELATLIQDGLALAAEQAQAAGSLRDVVARREELHLRGDHLREYIVAALRKRYGTTSARLVEFGVRPRSFTRRRTEATPSPANPGENPAPPPSDS